MKYQKFVAILAFVAVGPLLGFTLTTAFYLILVVPETGYFFERLLNEVGFILLLCYGVGFLPALGAGICFVCQRDASNQILSTILVGVITSCLLSILLAPWLMWMMRLPLIFIIPLFMIVGGVSALVIAKTLTLLMGKPIRRRHD